MSIPKEYHQTPNFSIRREDGRFTHIHKHMLDPTRSIVVIGDEVLDWTPYLNGQMNAGLIKKK